LKIALAGKQMMLLSPNLPNRLPAAPRGPIAPHQLIRFHAERTTVPHNS